MQFDDYQKIITDCIEKYQKTDGKAPNYYNKAKNQIDLYQIYLQDSMAAQSRFKWLNNQKELLKKIQQTKMVVKDEQQIKQILEVGEDIDKRLDEIHKDTQKAIQASTYIRIELQKQIEALDNLQDENKQFKKRIKRAKKGLQVIIRRAMMNKCTQFLMILVILAIIGLIVVSILVDKGIISVKADMLLAYQPPTK